MVARLVGLKARLLWNGLRADWQRRIGLPATMALLGGIAWYLATRYQATLNLLSTEAAFEFSAWSALAFYAIWVTLPVVIFPLDENLDPAQFALAPVPPARLITGLGAAAFVSPSSIVLVVVLGSNLLAFSQVPVMAAVSVLLSLALLVVSSQLFTTVISAVLRTRRGRDLSMVIVGAIGLVGFTSQDVIRRTVDRLGLEAAVLGHPVSELAWILPPVATQRVAIDASLGRPGWSMLWIAVSVVWIMALAWLWNRLLAWMLTTPEASAGPARRTRSRGLAGGGSWGVRAVMARKELRFYLRDPRQRLVWTGAVIFLAVAAATALFGTRGLAAFQGRFWLPLLAPALVLFVGLPIALNLFGWERNAASFLFVLPADPRKLIAGKNLAAAVALTLETAILAFILAVLGDAWTTLEFVPTLTVAAIGCQMTIGNLVSVLAPLRLPREGTDVFSQATEQGCLAIGAQLVAFFIIGLLLVAPASVVVLAVSFGQALPNWIAHVFSVVWGVTLYLISLRLSSWILRRRVPEMVSWVQVV